jgi:hypothetical protein
MSKETTDNTSSFICYNCNEKNYFDKGKYLFTDEGEKKSGQLVKEVTIECKNCREKNNVTIEY